MNEPTEKLVTLVGYNCEVCHGDNIVVTDNEIIHLCSGFLIPVYEVVEQ